jgi:hypothetical protein
MKCQRPNCTNLNYTATPFCDKHAPEWRRQQGRTWVPVEPARAHVQRLRDAGVSWKQIAALSGVNSWVVRNIVNTDQGHVRASTERGLLSVPVPEREHELALPGAFVPGLGTQRRLRALVALGYSNERLAEEIDYPKTQFQRLLSGEFDVTAKVARRAGEVFERLQMVPPPDGYAANRARLRAVRRGWVVPLCWDEDTIDDPRARPHVPIVRADDWMPEYEKLCAKGYSKKKIAALLGIEECSLNTRLRRARAA